MLLIYILYMEGNLDKREEKERYNDPVGEYRRKSKSWVLSQGYGSYGDRDGYQSRYSKDEPKWGWFGPDRETNFIRDINRQFGGDVFDFKLKNSMPKWFDARDAREKMYEKVLRESYSDANKDVDTVKQDSEYNELCRAEVAALQEYAEQYEDDKKTAIEALIDLYKRDPFRLERKARIVGFRPDLIGNNKGETGIVGGDNTLDQEPEDPESNFSLGEEDPLKGN